MKEIWKDVEGYGGAYQVSNLGRIKSLDRKVKRGPNSTLTIKKKILKSYKKDRYEKVMLSLNGKTRFLYIHRLIATAFIPNPENKREVNHKDLNPFNNSLDNLEWATPKENMAHSQEKRSKYIRKGERSQTSKLDDMGVMTTYTFIAHNMKNPEVAKHLKVDTSTICNIKNAKTWKHLAHCRP